MIVDSPLAVSTPLSLVAPLSLPQQSLARPDAVCDKDLAARWWAEIVRDVVAVANSGGGKLEIVLPPFIARNNGANLGTSAWFIKTLAERLF